MKGTFKFKKVHHQVDYRSFKNNKFILKDKFEYHKDPTYGLILK